MRKLVISLALIGGALVFSPANSVAASACVPGSAPLYCIPPATPAAAARESASAAASSLTSLAHGALAAKGAAKLQVLASGPGTITITLTAKIHGRIVVVGSGVAVAHGVGTVALDFKLTRAGKAALARTKGKLTIKATFRPKHGKAKSSKTAVSLK